MKIVTDKVSSEPFHSISKQDIQVVIRNIPKDWIGIANVFKISSQLFSNSKWSRPVIENNTTFIIMSRGFDRDYIIKELLIELALSPCGIYAVNAHRVTKNQRWKLETMIQPMFDNIIKELNELSTENKNGRLREL